MLDDEAIIENNYYKIKRELINIQNFRTKEYFMFHLFRNFTEYKLKVIFSI